jgi:hypothetical protein
VQHQRARQRTVSSLWAATRPAVRYQEHCCCNRSRPAAMRPILGCWHARPAGGEAGRQMAWLEGQQMDVEGGRWTAVAADQTLSDALGGCRWTAEAAKPSISGSAGRRQSWHGFPRRPYYLFGTPRRAHSTGYTHCPLLYYMYCLIISMRNESHMARTEQVTAVNRTKSRARAPPGAAHATHSAHRSIQDHPIKKRRDTHHAHTSHNPLPYIV